MDKKALIKHLGGVAEAAKKLGYKNKQSVYQWPQTLTERQVAVVTMRAKANGIQLP